MYDSIDQIGYSMIQHGKYNNRIYLMKLSYEDFPWIIDQLDEMANNYGYTKIFAKIPDWTWESFQENNYYKEAMIPDFYNEETDVFFVSKYLDPSRETMDCKSKQKVGNIIQIAQSKQANISIDHSTFDLQMLGEDDVPRLTHLYKNVFQTYPFPIFDDQYIRETMADNIVYFGTFDKDRLIAASSAELDQSDSNVEMTDFATLPAYRGNGLATELLLKMETDMQKRDVKTAYTIARAISPGMNITFSKLGYHYTGTLINNTNISGNIESMNVWYKKL